MTSVAGRTKRVREQAPIEELIAVMTVDELHEVVSAAVDLHDDVERHVRLIAARAEGDLAQLRAEVDRGLRTRRFLATARAEDGPKPPARSWANSGRWSRVHRPRSWSSCCSARSVTSSK